MRCLITGGRGFVGGHLAAALRAEEHEVTLLDRAELDVADRSAVQQRFSTACPEVVFHLAALSHVGESWGEADEVRRVNVGGTEAVLNAAETVETRVAVVVGSAEEYGRVAPRDIPISEEHPLAPESPYGQSKAEATRLAVEFARGSALRVVIARPFNHTGPGQSAKFLVPGLAARIAAAKRSEHHTIAVGNLDTVRDIADVRDVARAYLALASLGVDGETYNVCTGHGVSVRQVAESLIAASGVSLELQTDLDLVRSVDIPVLIGDHSKLSAATGWQPLIPLHRTMKDVLDCA